MRTMYSRLVCLRMAASFSYCLRVETKAIRASEFCKTNRHCSEVWVA